MINDMLQQCDFATVTNRNGELKHLPEKDPKAIASLITLAENDGLSLTPKPLSGREGLKKRAR